MKKIKVNLGCGYSLARGFYNVDIAISPWEMEDFYKKVKKKKIPEDARFIQAAVQDLPFEDNSVDYMESTDMIEHLPMRDVAGTFKEMYRVMKPGGKLLIVTTDFDDVARTWLDASAKFTELVTSGGDPSTMFDEKFESEVWLDVCRRAINLRMMIIYGNQAHPGEMHMNAFTPSIMYVYLTQAGFDKEKIKISIHERGSRTPRTPGGNITEADAIKYPLLNSMVVAEVIK